MPSVCCWILLTNWIDKYAEISRRHATADRAENEVNDIIRLLQFADEKIVLDRLPIYVTANVNKMSMVSLAVGDFLFLSGNDW